MYKLWRFVTWILSNPNKGFYFEGKVSTSLNTSFYSILVIHRLNPKFGDTVEDRSNRSYQYSFTSLTDKSQIWYVW